MYARILALGKLLNMFASEQKDNHLLLVLISGIVTTTSGGGTSALSLRSARSATSIWRGESEVDVLYKMGEMISDCRVAKLKSGGEK